MLCLLVSRNRKALICVALGISSESVMEKPNALIFLFVRELPRSGSDLRWVTKGSLCCFPLFLQRVAKTQALLSQSDQNLREDTTSQLIVLLQCHCVDFHLQPNQYQVIFFHDSFCLFVFFDLFACMEISVPQNKPLGYVLMKTQHSGECFQALETLTRIN